ncbi:MAG: hypothetical protein Q4D80_03335, partial [Pseudomonadota bacterium]|nr:hypothetical protein [Pseudomonadota bacterium]
SNAPISDTVHTPEGVFLFLSKYRLWNRQRQIFLPHHRACKNFSPHAQSPEQLTQLHKPAKISQ